VDEEGNAAARSVEPPDEHAERAAPALLPAKAAMPRLNPRAGQGAYNANDTRMGTVHSPARSIFAPTPASTSDRPTLR
jgi:hypothetical protein